MTPQSKLKMSTLLIFPTLYTTTPGGEEVFVWGRAQSTRPQTP